MEDVGERKPFINVEGFNITVYRQRDGNWSGTIEDRATGQSIQARKKYPTKDQAKLAAFDGMIFLQNERGWGRQRRAR